MKVRNKHEKFPSTDDFKCLDFKHFLKGHLLKGCCFKCLYFKQVQTLQSQRENWGTCLTSLAVEVRLSQTHTFTWNEGDLLSSTFSIGSLLLLRIMKADKPE